MKTATLSTLLALAAAATLPFAHANTTPKPATSDLVDEAAAADTAAYVKQKRHDTDADISAASVARRAWFEDARFGMFIHWGPYSAYEGTWKNHTLPDKTLPNGVSWYAEWIQSRLAIPDEEYRATALSFNPEKFDAEALILEAKRAGMKYIAITAKHHDGFALWDSAVSDYDLGSTPCKRDILGELAAACKKHDIKLGFYYSHWQDWSVKGGAKPTWKNAWKPQATDAEFEEYWQGKCLPQVAELLERYDPALMWFDTWGDEAKDHITVKRRDELINLIRTKRPKCIINGRIADHNPGKDVDFLEMGDNQFPSQWPGRPWQSPATMQHSWGYHANDFAWKPSGAMVRLLAQCSALGGNYLLNIGPKFDGSLPAPTLRRLRELGGWVAANGDSFRNTKRLGKAPFGWWTQSKDETIRYAHVFDWPANKLLPLGKLDCKPLAAHILETNQELALTETAPGEWSVKVPARAPDDYDSVIAIRVEKK